MSRPSSEWDRYGMEFSCHGCDFFMKLKNHKKNIQVFVRVVSIVK